GPLLAGGGSVGPPAVHCSSFAVRRLPHLPCPGRRRKRERHATLVADLAAAVTPRHVCRVFLRRGGRGGIGAADVAIPSSRGDPLRGSASQFAADRSHLL